MKLGANDTYNCVGNAYEFCDRENAERKMITGARTNNGQL